MHPVEKYNRRRPQKTTTWPPASRPVEPGTVRKSKGGFGAYGSSCSAERGRESEWKWKAVVASVASPVVESGCAMAGRSRGRRRWTPAARVLHCFGDLWASFRPHLGPVTIMFSAFQPVFPNKNQLYGAARY